MCICIICIVDVYLYVYTYILYAYRSSSDKEQVCLLLFDHADDQVSLFVAHLKAPWIG